MVDTSKAGTFSTRRPQRESPRLRRHATRRARRLRAAEGPRRRARRAARGGGGGVNHIDTSDFYGPHVTNQIIREALHPYPDDLVIVTKIGARRGEDGSWNSGFLGRGADARGARQSAQSRRRRARVVNLRIMFGIHGPAEGSIEAPLTVLAELAAARAWSATSA